jgi:uncharacterized OB-fold protein
MTQESTVPKPIPEADEASAPFFEGTLAGQLLLMRCTACGTVRMPSRMHCDACLDTGVEWVAASGRATLRSFGVMHQRYHPAFADDLPYNIALVELEEGPRMVSNVVGAANDELRVDMALVVDWERHEDLGVALPKFRPA